MYTIRKIDAKRTFDVRHPVLRAGKPRSSCYFEGDNNNDTLHFGVFKDNNLLGVASLFVSENEFFESQKQWQLRGMAVLEAHQNKGLGRLLLQYCESFLQKKGSYLLWFNARKTAVPFYSRLGFATHGNFFDIPDVGSHIVMHKNIYHEIACTTK